MAVRSGRSTPRKEALGLPLHGLPMYAPHGQHTPGRPFLSIAWPPSPGDDWTPAPLPRPPSLPFAAPSFASYLTRHDTTARRGPLLRPNKRRPPATIAATPSRPPRPMVDDGRTCPPSPSITHALRHGPLVRSPQAWSPDVTAPADWPRRASDGDGAACFWSPAHHHQHGGSTAGPRCWGERGGGLGRCSSLSPAFWHGKRQHRGGGGPRSRLPRPTGQWWSGCR